MYQFTFFFYQDIWPCKTMLGLLSGFGEGPAQMKSSEANISQFFDKTTELRWLSQAVRMSTSGECTREKPIHVFKGS